MNITAPEEIGLCRNKLNDIDKLTESYINAGEIAGSITLLARRGKIAHFSCQGKMSLEAAKPMQADAIFRIYSMTKPITTVAAMMLYERGAFDLTTPISTFIPEFKHTEVFVSGTASRYTSEKPEREIIMADLLTHTAGLTYDFFFSSVVDEIYRNNGTSGLHIKQHSADFARLIAKMPLLFSPGKKWNYSHATDILGHIIEIISGMSLDQFFKREIFDPLAMDDTGFYVPASKMNRFTTNYMHHTGISKEITDQQPDKKLFVIDDPTTGQFSSLPMMCSGGGGLVSTASDYLKFCNMLLNNGRSGNHILLSRKSIALMTTNQLPTDLDDYSFAKNAESSRPGTGFGYGFSVNLNPTKSNLLGSPGEFGWSGAANTYFFVDPKEDMIAIYLTQTFPFDITGEKLRRFKAAVYQAII